MESETSPQTEKPSWFSIAGIPLRLHFSIHLAILWVLLDSRLTPDTPGQIIILTAGGLLSLMLHETAHVVVARRLRCPPADIQLTLLAGIHRYRTPPSKPHLEVLTAGAGPLCSLLVGGFFLLLPLLATGDAGWTLLCRMLAAANVLLASINMLPLFPFDGARMLRAWMAARIGRFDATRRLVQVGGWGALSLAGWGLINGYWEAVVLAWLIHALARAELRRVQWETNGRPASVFEMLWQMTNQRRTPPAERSVDIDVEVGPPPYKR